MAKFHPRSDCFDFRSITGVARKSFRTKPAVRFRHEGVPGANHSRTGHLNQVLSQIILHATAQPPAVVRRRSTLRKL
jgi:hypothetical protein